MMIEPAVPAARGRQRQRLALATGLLGLVGASPAFAQNMFAPPTSTASASIGAQATNASQAQSTASAPVPVTTAAPPMAKTLAQPIQANAIRSNDRYQAALLDQVDNAQRPAPRAPAPPSAFENYTATVLGRRLPRFGSNLLLPDALDFTPPPTTTVPPEYTLNPGDTLLLNITGSAESSLALTVDNDGRIFIPQVGAVNVAGVRYGDLPDFLRRAVGRQFREFRVSVSIASLHGIRVYVTGFAAAPGSYSLNSLSTLVNAVLAAGGPSAGGSFRSIELLRGNQIIARFDLYDLLLHGDRSQDVVLQNDDVIRIDPVGPQVAVSGSVNSEAIYETRPGDTIEQVLTDAGGLNTLADNSRLVIAKLSNLDKTGWQQFDMETALAAPVTGGDILRVLSQADLAQPIERQAVLVTIEGEVQRPGRYFLPPGATVADLMQRVGPLTPRAFVYGTEFDRVLVQAQQQKGFDDAIQQLELSLAAAPLTAGVSNVSDPALRGAQLQAARNVIDQLRQRKPDGRVVLDLSPGASSLPTDIPLQNNDRIYVPPRPETIGVFGAVFRPGSFSIAPSGTIEQYLVKAGGPQRIADNHEIFVVRANGEVITRRRGALKVQALPGDVIFVPVKTHSNSILGAIKDVTTILFQLGLAAAAIAALNN